MTEISGILQANGEQPIFGGESYRQMASNPENTALQEKQQNQRFLPEKTRQYKRLHE